MSAQRSPSSPRTSVVSTGGRSRVEEGTSAHETAQRRAIARLGKDPVVQVVREVGAGVVDPGSADELERHRPDVTGTRNRCTLASSRPVRSSRVGPAPRRPTVPLCACAGDAVLEMEELKAERLRRPMVSVRPAVRPAVGPSPVRVTGSCRRRRRPTPSKPATRHAVSTSGSGTKPGSMGGGRRTRCPRATAAPRSEQRRSAGRQRPLAAPPLRPGSSGSAGRARW